MTLLKSRPVVLVPDERTSQEMRRRLSTVPRERVVTLVQRLRQSSLPPEGEVGEVGMSEGTEPPKAA